MITYRHFFSPLSFLLLLACTGLPPAVEHAPAVQLDYDQVTRDISQYQGTPVRWGGVIIDVENDEDSSLIQVVFHPLDFSGRPQLRKTGQGRFVIKSAEFLDPAVYAKDKEITVAGVLSEKIERTVGKRLIHVPLVMANALYLWPTDYYDSRQYGPYPYYGYPGYAPIYRGGFYGPYFRW